MYSNEVNESSDDTAFLSTLSNGLRAMEILADGRRTIRSLAEELGLPRQTTYRVVHTLDVMGWVERHASDDTYALSTRLWAVGVRSHESTDLRAKWSDIVHRLGDDTGETVHLAVYDQGWSVYIDKHDGWHPIRSYTKLGGRSPAYCVATGKALLAAQREPDRERVITGKLEKFTENTITDPARLRSELSAINEVGHAINNGEYRAEVGGIAVPIHSPFGDVVAALGFSGPNTRIHERSDELLTALRSVTADNRAQRSESPLAKPAL